MVYKPCTCFIFVIHWAVFYRYDYDDPDFEMVRNFTNVFVSGQGAVSLINYFPTWIVKLFSRKVRTADTQRSLIKVFTWRSLDTEDILFLHAQAKTKSECAMILIMIQVLTGWPLQQKVSQRSSITNLLTLSLLFTTYYVFRGYLSTSQDLQKQDILSILYW